MPDHDEPRSDNQERVGEAVAWYFQAAEAGRPPAPADFLARFPGLRPELESFLADKAAFDQAAGSPPDFQFTLPHSPGLSPGTIAHVPSDNLDSTLAPAPGPDATFPTSGSDAAADGSIGSVRYFGDYELRSEIAQGGMGIVFKARQVSLNREVALKMIRSGQLASAADIARFYAEAEAAANLDHPNILPIYEVGEHKRQQYFSMKFAPGGSLAARVAGLVQNPKAAVAVLGKVCRAIDFAHRRGILHRDLKPGNILLDTDGTPYVTDFGLAKKVEGDSNLTQPGVIVGTPSYMAPEQARAEKGLTTGVDIYALGAILYELLTGQPPFRGPTVMDTILQVLEREPTHPAVVKPRADRDLSVIALKCLEKDPGKRYESAAALADDLDRWLRGEPILARPASRFERTAKWVRRNPAVAALATLAVIMLVGGTAVSMYFAGEAKWEAKDAKTQRARAEQEERRAIDRLARMYLTNGMQRLDADDALGSLPYFVEALRLDEHDSDRAAVHRARLAECFRRSPKLVGFWAPESPAESVTFTPDDARVVTGHSDGIARVWNVSTGELQFTLQHGGKNCKAVVSSDGRWVVTHFNREEFWLSDRVQVGQVTEHKQIKVWDLRTGRAIHTLEHDGLAGRSAFSKDGSRLVTVSNRVVKEEQFQTVECGSIRVWDVVSGKPSTTPLELGPEVGVRDAHFDPTGVRVVAEPARGDGPAQGWEVATGKPVSFNLNDPDMVGKPFADPLLRFSPDGSRIFAGRGSSARLFDAKTRKPIGEALHSHLTNIDPDSIRFTADGRFLTWETSVNPRAVADGVPMQGMVQMFDTQNGRMVGKPLAHEGRRKYTTVLDHATTPDGRYVATGCDDGTARVWSPYLYQSATPYLPHEGPVRTVALSSDGRRLVTGTNDHVRVWDLSFHRILDPTPGDAIGYRKVIAEGGRRFMVTIDSHYLDSAPDDVPEDPSVKLLQSEKDPGEGATVEVWDRLAQRRLGPPLRHPKRVLQAALTDDCRFLATRTVDHRWRVWEVASGNPVGSGGQHPGKASQLLLLPGARYLATVGPGTAGQVEGDPNRLIRVWDVATGAEAIPETQVTGTRTYLHAAPDGIRFAVTRADEFLVQILFADGRPPVTIPNSPELGTSVTWLAFSPDSSRFATAANKPSMTRIWDAATAEPLTPPLVHTKPVNQIAFDPVGERVVTSSDDGTARVWSAISGDRLTPSMRFPTAVVDAQFTRSGSMVVCRSRDPDYRLMPNVEGDAFRAFDARTGSPLGPLVPEVPEYEGQSAAAYARIDEAEPDARPTEVLRTWAELLSGQRIDETGGLVALTRDEFVSRWELVRTVDPQGLRPPDADLLAWHRHEAFWKPRYSSFRDDDDPATLTHLNALLAANPEVPAWRERRGHVLTRVGRWAEARADCEAAIAHGVDNEHTLEIASLLSLWAGDRAAAGRHADVMFRRGRATTLNLGDPVYFFRSRLRSNFESAIRVAALANLPETDFAALARECDRLGDAMTDESRAMAYYRAGRIGEAAAIWRGSIAANLRHKSLGSPEAWAWLGLLEYRRCRGLVGLACLAVADQRSRATPDIPDALTSRLIVALLLKEASR